MTTIAVHKPGGRLIGRMTPMNRMNGDGIMYLLLQGSGAWIASYWATMPATSGLLGFLALVDFATGVMAGVRSDGYSKKKFVDGIVEKVGMFVVIIVAHEISKPLGFLGDIASVVALFYSASETVSIFKNLKTLNVTLPTFLVSAVEKVRGEASEQQPKK